MKVTTINHKLLKIVSRKQALSLGVDKFKLDSECRWFAINLNHCNKDNSRVIGFETKVLALRYSHQHWVQRYSVLDEVA